MRKQVLIIQIRFFNHVDAGYEIYKISNTEIVGWVKSVVMIIGKTIFFCNIYLGYVK